MRRDGPDEPFYRAGIWEVQPSRFRRPCAGNETFHVLAGRATVTSDSGATVELRGGHVASFPPNTVAVWTVTEPLRALLVASM